MTLLTKTSDVLSDVNPISDLSLGKLEPNESLALAKIVKAHSPFFPAVVREDESSLEPESLKIVMYSPCALNAEEQRGATEMLRAVKLVNAATNCRSAQMTGSRCTQGHPIQV